MGVTVAGDRIPCHLSLTHFLPAVTAEEHTHIMGSRVGISLAGVQNNARSSMSPQLLITKKNFIFYFHFQFVQGLIKIRGDQCWRDLTCMNYHYEVQTLHCNKYNSHHSNTYASTLDSAST